MYDIHSTTNPYLDKVRSHTEPYTTEVLGKEIIVYPNVMSPKYDWSSRFYIEQLPDQTGKDVLEVGCGSGVISLFAGLQGASKITALDINPHALENTQANFEKYNLSNTEVLESDVFEKVGGKYDTIFFNAPYHGNEPQDILERGVSDHNYEVLRKFLKDAKKYLNKDGSVYLGFSNTGDTDVLNHLILENKYLLVERKEETNEGWTAYLYELKPLKFINHWLELFFEDNLHFFKQYEDLIKTGKILYVGHGNGQTVYSISLWNDNVVGLDITLYEHALAKDKVVLYEGQHFPFEDNSFDTVICNYVLHHTTDPMEILKEIKRVSSKSIVIVEETHDTFLQKLDQVLFDWYANKSADQEVNIQWKSYFTRKGIREVIDKLGLRIENVTTEKRRRFWVEQFILKDIKGEYTEINSIE